MNNDLLCAESLYADSQKAIKDAAILDDKRVLEELLQTEFLHIPQKNRGTGDLDPETRRIITKWMLEVSDEENCDGPVLPLAVNFLDRYVSETIVPRNLLQLIASDCLLVASKIRQTWSLSVNKLCYYTADSITPNQLRSYEFLLVSKLNWELAAVTAFDYVDQILRRVTWCSVKQEMIVRVHSITLIHLCSTDNDFFAVSPSILAISCIICSMMGIHVSMEQDRISFICDLVNASLSTVEEICAKIEKLVAEEIAILNQPGIKFGETLFKENVPKYAIIKNKQKKPQTPVDVQDIDF